jgi:hypothetical protein
MINPEMKEGNKKNEFYVCGSISGGSVSGLACFRINGKHMILSRSV